MREILPEIVRRAMVETVTDIGQITHQQRLELNRAIRHGYLSKGKGGSFPALKTVYACPTFDFAADREAWYQEAVAWAHADALRFNDERYELR